ncbi:MAG: site-specific integrase [Byssovorax sp.]
MTLLDAVRSTFRRLHDSSRTEEAYLHWLRELIRFHRGLHPRELGAPEITAFLNHLAVERPTSASTQNPAPCAILFLYKGVLDQLAPRLHLIGETLHRSGLRALPGPQAAHLSGSTRLPATQHPLSPRAHPLDATRAPFPLSTRNVGPRTS